MHYVFLFLAEQTLYKFPPGTGKTEIQIEEDRLSVFISN